MYSITFLSPEWLLLGLLAPCVIYLSRGGLSSLTGARKFVAVGLRLVVLLLLVAALADMQIAKRIRQRCVLFVVDKSLSVTPAVADEFNSIVSRAISRRPLDNDEVGVIAFGSQAALELPPARYPRDRRIPLDAIVDREQSNLAAGLKLAQASRPPDRATRVVLLSDGNQNREDALPEAVRSAQLGVPIDVLLRDEERADEILVEQVQVASDAKEGSTVSAKVAIRSSREATGRLRVDLVSGENRRTLIDRSQRLAEGLSVIALEQKIDLPGLYRFEAEFIPDDPSHDRFARNNRATASCLLRGKGRVLLVQRSKGAQQPLVDALVAEKFDVTVIVPSELSTDPERYRSFDGLILADVPAVDVPEDIQRSLTTQVRELGVGLIVAGGPNSYGPGGYKGSLLEEALPVTCDVKASLVRGALAMVLVIDRSGSMSGQKLAMAVQGARASLDHVLPTDSVGVVAFDSDATWVRRLGPVDDVKAIDRRLRTIGAGGGTNMYPALEEAKKALLATNAMVRHVILLTDGHSSSGDSNRLFREMAAAKISLSCVGVGDDADVALLRSMARATGGRFYHTLHPRTVPGIFINEIKIVSRPHIYEKDTPWSPVRSGLSDIVRGMPEKLPGIRGFVLTTPKASAEISVTSPLPTDLEVNPLVAQWQYGLGKVVAVTTDAGARWTTAWRDSSFFSTFWAQAVRWSLKAADSDDLTIAVQEKDGNVRVVVNALDRQKGYLDLLAMKGTIVRPDSRSESLELKQTEPGKYVGQFSAGASGSYVVSVGARLPGGQTGAVSSVVNLSYPAEYRDHSHNRALLENIAMTSGGAVLHDLAEHPEEVFRGEPPARFQLTEIWPLLLLAALLIFFGDVAARRVRLELETIAVASKRVWAMIRREPAPAAASVVIERLSVRKREVAARLAEPVSSAPLRPLDPPIVTTPRAANPLAAPSAPSNSPASPPGSSSPSPETPPATQPESSDSMGRLLAAKRRLRKENDNPG